MSDHDTTATCFFCSKKVFILFLYNMEDYYYTDGIQLLVVVSHLLNKK